jgi:hypothetical protein
VKKWWKSKTVWFNVVSGAIVICNELAGKVIPTEVATSVVVVGNVVLRFLTHDALTGGDK